MNPSYYDLEETSSAAINVFLSRYYSIFGSLLCALCVVFVMWVPGDEQ